MGIYVTTRAVRSIQVAPRDGRRSISDPAGTQHPISGNTPAPCRDRARHEFPQHEAMTAVPDGDSQVESLCWWAR